MRVLVTGSSGLIGSEAVLRTTYQEQARKGDHICYISDLTKFQTDYPAWGLSYSLDAILEELVRG